ncbi:hypothetical protein CC1G_12054 [Coprinopsis cinerea okayama7|uniref:DNA-directed RNA polymerase III subunit RPC4 n=1 Tax=Coprinopsis cinerea (strain Okayama-7 / 130 / ATCC MYA-4618 / FGSC 9003) TaxID=240176 RepID=A8N9L6_COPC7|nr:hypothetical protein CC1G_12054 [Coprinopsis cinerea okayama7\|eukprot:XP_001831522.1 hypothetical protein CC1G_12054 [Coprinopsis cinerea okayama7\
MADSNAPSGSGTPKAIPSLAKRPSDVTRQGTSRLKFVPTLPQRRKKEEVKAEPTPDVIPEASGTSGRGRGGARGGRGDGRGRGRGGRPGGPPPVVMTASGPFALGPTLAGSSARRSTPRSNFAPSIASSTSGSSSLGAGLSQTAPPTLKKDLNDLKGKGKEVKKEEDDDVEVYSDPDDGVEIIDIEQVRGLDYMAPESLRRDRSSKKKKVKKEKSAEDQVDHDIDHANALDLSEDEEEEEAELEDVIEDFAAQVNLESDNDLREEKIYLFQFPTPFPTFVQPETADNSAVSAGATDGDVEMTDGTGAGTTTGKKAVSFGPDVKPAAAPGVAGGAAPGMASRTPSGSGAAAEEKKPPKPVDGVIGQLELYKSGAVKIRLANGILLDVSRLLLDIIRLDFLTHSVFLLGSPPFPLSPIDLFRKREQVNPATQPSFLQQVVHVDHIHEKRISVLGEINKQFVVSPNVEALLEALDKADRMAPVLPKIEGEEKLIRMK